MTKIAFLLFVWGPALVGYALGWLIRHSDDWTGPAVIAPVGLALTAISYRWGARRLSTIEKEGRPYFLAGMIAAALLGVVLFGMLALGIIG